MKKLIAMICLMGVVAGVSACAEGNGTVDANKPVFSSEGTAGAGQEGSVAAADGVFEKKMAK